MTTPNPVLSEMINAAPEQSEAAQKNLDQINETQSELEDKSTALEDDVCGVAATDQAAYLDSTKVIEIQLIYGNPSSIPFSVVYEPDYGVVDYITGQITDFAILDSTGNTMYEYLGTNWDNDPIIQTFIDDFAFANDYITHPLEQGAAYGLDALINAYESAKTTVQAGKDVVDASVDVLERYL